MKNLLIIYPHWPPSNLAGVHRPRLIANNLKKFGWHPVILTVHEQYYEEKADNAMKELVSPDVEVIKTRAFRVPKPRIVGDIGLRSFIFLYREAISIAQHRKIDFVWIPIPSFYCALLGPLLRRKANLKFGIDYIDPWLRDISGRKNFRSILSIMMARILEPMAIRNASLISGVAAEYYSPSLRRYGMKGKVAEVAMPYGFDPGDHKIVYRDSKRLWKDHERAILYAGAFLPNSKVYLELLFRAVSELNNGGKWDMDLKLIFVGTGTYSGKSIEDYAAEAGISDYVREYRDRIPYLAVLDLLSRAHGVLVLGSTEKHYTASKIFQALLSGRPVITLFHAESTSVEIVRKAGMDEYLAAYSDGHPEEMYRKILEVLNRFAESPSFPSANLKELAEYSSETSAARLVGKIEEVISAS